MKKSSPPSAFKSTPAYHISAPFSAYAIHAWPPSLLSIFNGERNAYRDIVVLNSAACLIIAGKAQNLTEGASISSDMIDSGKAMEKLEALKEITNR